MGRLVSDSYSSQMNSMIAQSLHIVIHEYNVYWNIFHLEYILFIYVLESKLFEIYDEFGSKTQ